MESLAQLQKTVMQGIAEMMCDKEKMESLKAYIDELQQEDFADDSEMMSEEEQEQLMEDIRQGLREVRLEREGKLELQNARDFIHEFQQSDFEPDSGMMSEEEQEQLMEDIRQGLREVKLMREGKMEKHYLRELIDEL